MARRKQEITLEAGKRLRQLCRELGVSQKQLAEAAMVSENTLSKIATGRGPLTRPVAEAIIAACPSYRIEWLMGDDDHAHNTTALEIPGLVTAKWCLAAVNLLTALGVSVGQVTDKGLFLPVSEAGGFLYGVGDRAEIRRGNAVVWSGDIRAIESALLEICDFSLFKIELLAKRTVG